MTTPVAVLRRCKDGEAEYDQLWFACPGCASRDGDHTGLHALPVHRLGEDRPITKRHSWQWNGDLLLPTLAPSILSRSEWAGVLFVCHSFLVAGVFQFLGDCTHKHVNQHVPIGPLPEWFLRE